MNAAPPSPSRDNIQGALNSVLTELRHEAENLVKLPSYFEQVSQPEHASKAQVTVERIASMRLSGAELAAIFKADVDARARLVGIEDKPAADLFRWEAIGSVLSPESIIKPAGEREYDEAVNILFAEKNRCARLAALPLGMTVGELLATDFPPPQWIFPELLVSGLTIFAGAPKLGKSFFALALGVAVGIGGAVLGRYRVERRGALYLALEDTPRRLKNRLEKIGAVHDSRLSLFTQWRKGAEGNADLDAYLDEHEDVKLILIDTLAGFRGPPQFKDQYSEDYRAASSIKAIADKHDCAIVVIHHVRKMEAEDPMDLVSGSNGLNGGADSTWILKRARGESDASLFITGRDVEEQTLALRFDSACGSWTVLGDSAEFAKSRERREVLEAVPFVPTTRKTKDIVALVDKKPAAVSRLLEKLEAEGLIFSPKYGEWSRRSGKSGKSVNVQETVKEPEQGIFTLLPDLPVFTATQAASPNISTVTHKGESMQN
ncbi:MAG: AAA family ATPase [Rectinemataceae bacterium]|jgi:hypothetical protein